MNDQHGTLQLICIKYSFGIDIGHVHCDPSDVLSSIIVDP